MVQVGEEVEEVVVMEMLKEYFHYELNLREKMS